MRLHTALLAWALASWAPTVVLAEGMWLVDETASSGIDFEHVHGGEGRRYLPETMGAGGCVLDYDGDGWMDIYLVQSGRLPWVDGDEEPELGNRLFRSLGGGRFQDVTPQSGTGDRGYGQGAVCGDLDGDGAPDILVNNFGPNVLLRNRADGTFSDVSTEAGLADPLWATSASLFDADGDGDLDLYVVNYLDYGLATHRECRNKQVDELLYCHPDAYPMAPDRLFRNLGHLRFRDATQEMGLEDRTGKGLGVVAADLDSDGLVDLYVTNDSTPNFLYRNLGGGHFEEVGLFEGASFNEEGRTEAGMGVDVGDLNGDLRFDLFVANLSMETNTLYLQGETGFVDVTRGAGLHALSLPVLGFGTDLLDLDNDGDLDIVVANGDLHDNIEVFNDALRWKQPGQVLLNDGRARFRELGAAEVGDFGLPGVGRGLMTVDIDHDGGLDLVVNYSGDRARLFRNRAARGEWIGFQLRALGPNLAAIGARVTIESGNRKQVAAVVAGSGYASSSDPRVHFGLGEDPGDVVVEVHWPDASVGRWKGLRSGRYHLLRQGAERGGS